MKLLNREIVCRQAVELMSDYVDGALPRRVARRLERHLVDCDACTEYLAQIRAAVKITGRVSPDELDPDTLDGLVELFHRFREEDS